MANIYPRNISTAASADGNKKTVALNISATVPALFKFTPY
jgi:hypothetical protein